MYNKATKTLPTRDTNLNSLKIALQMSRKSGQGYLQTSQAISNFPHGRKL